MRDELSNITHNVGRGVARRALRSPGHFAVAVVLLLAAGAVSAFLFNTATGHRRPVVAAAAPPVESLTAPVTVEPPAAADPGTPAAAVSSSPVGSAIPVVPGAVKYGTDPGELAAAQRFTTAWVNHPDGITPAVWAARLAPYTTPQLQGLLKLSDPANVPATQITGPGKIGSQADGTAVVTFPTDTYRVTVSVVATGGRWLVNDVTINP